MHILLAVLFSELLLTFSNMRGENDKSLGMRLVDWNSNENETLGNSMTNHPGLDTLTSQILLIFLLFVDSVEIINPWNFQPSTLYSSKVIEIWKFYQKFEFTVSVITIVLVIFLSWNLKRNHKWFFKITTITSYLKITSKIQE